LNLRIFAILAAVTLAFNTFAVSNLAQPVIARNNDKCFSKHNNDKRETNTICVAGDKELETLIKNLKKQCEESFGVWTNCSSPQTGNGAFDNYKNKP
jgi:hypothetical protein